MKCLFRLSIIAIMVLQISNIMALPLREVGGKDWKKFIQVQNNLQGLNLAVNPEENKKEFIEYISLIERDLKTDKDNKEVIDFLRKLRPSSSW